MSSDRCEDGRRRPHSGRTSKQWDHRDDGQKKRRDSHRGSLRDAFWTHGAEGNRHCPQRQDSRDWDHRDRDHRDRDHRDRDHRDWNHTSPLRRASPVWNVSEKRRPRHSEDGQSEDRHRCERHKRTWRQSADASPPPHATRYFKYRDCPQKSRPWCRLEESENHQQHNGVRRWSAGCREQEGPETSRDGSPEPNPQAHEGAVNFQRTKVPKQEEMKGFQRFLDVLNRGVNVDTLTKIMTQTSTDDFHQTSNLLLKSVDHTWTSNHLSPQNDGRSSHRQSLNPMRGLQDQVQLQDKTTPTPEDQKKCRQVHEVLQAIGMDLGFEELGQMSSRIKERLYGKKDGDLGQRVSTETGSRLPNSPRHRNGSSSSRSSFSLLPQDGAIKQDLLSTKRQKTQKGLSAECYLDFWSQQDQDHRDSGHQQDQDHRDSGHQQDQYRKNCGFLQAEQCDAASPQQSATPFPAEPPPRPSVHSPPPVISLHPPALLLSPLPSPSSVVLPHLAPGMFLPQQIPSNLSQAGPSITNPPPIDPLLPKPLPLSLVLLNPSSMNFLFPNPSPLNPSFPNPSPLNPSFPNPSPLNPSFPNPSPLNSKRVKAVPRRRCLQVIQTKPG